MKTLQSFAAAAIEKAADAAGFSLVPNWRVSKLPEERQLKRLLAHLQVDCVFDVGANVGQFGEMLRRRCGYRGAIISFEPNPAALENLRIAARGDPTWNIESFALGKSAGTATFNAFAQSVWGSFYAFDDMAHAPAGMPSTKIEVAVETLATYLPAARARLGFRRPFLKMDTQGFDLAVAMGAGDLLREFVGLQSEIAFQTIYAGAPSYRDAIDYYENYGFRLSGLVPIHEAYFPDLVEMDAIMINAHLPAASAAGDS
jgi:FkbM family methyltransferase